MQIHYPKLSDIDYLFTLNQLRSASLQYPDVKSMIVLHHTDLESDLLDMPNFVSHTRYSGVKPIHDSETGVIEKWRMIASPDMSIFQNRGAEISKNPKLYSHFDDRIDVYQSWVLDASKLSIEIFPNRFDDFYFDFQKFLRTIDTPEILLSKIFTGVTGLYLR